jgi:hypothetical protein
MASRPNRRRVWRLAAGLTSLALALAAAGAVNAHAGNPASIQVAQTGALTVQASGSWTWGEMATASKLSYAGFALDWGDTTTGNAVPKPGGGDYHIGDGTAATNLVMHPTSPAQGAAGTWGPVSHTYAQSGTYMVCVVVYDLGEVTPFKTSGYHGLTAGGPNRNTDNSAEKNSTGSTSCMSLDVVVPTASPTTAPSSAAPSLEAPSAAASATATPVQSVQGATSQPSGTPPVTATLPIDTPNNGNALPFALLLLFSGSGLFTVLAIKPIRESRRDR